MSRTWRFVSDLFGDGYAIIGVAAPLLSIAFTVAKALDLPILGHLREISYAWAFAPLTVWFLVAYVRLRARHNEPGGIGPDWTIRELFQYIRPRDLQESENYEAVGAQVLDALSTGQLTAWGRRHRPQQQQRAPLELISFIFWGDAFLSYLFILPDHEDAVHATGTDLTTNTSYSDIRVSKVQARRIWPR